MCKPRGEGGAGGKVAGMSRSSCFIQYSDFETQPPFNLSPPWLPAVVALCQSSPWPVDWALLTPPLVLPARPGAHQTGPPLVEPWGLRLFELGILVRGKLLIGWVCVCVDVWVDMWWGGYGGSNRVSMERQKLEHYRTAVNVCTSDNYCKKPIVCKHPITCTRVRTHTHTCTHVHTHTHTHTCTHTHTLLTLSQSAILACSLLTSHTETGSDWTVSGGEKLLTLRHLHSNLTSELLGVNPTNVSCDINKKRIAISTW